MDLSQRALQTDGWIFEFRIFDKKKKKKARREYYQIAMCYISMDSSQWALQSNEKLFFKFLIHLRNFDWKPKNIRKNSKAWILNIMRKLLQVCTSERPFHFCGWQKPGFYLKKKHGIYCFFLFRVLMGFFGLLINF